LRFPTPAAPGEARQERADGVDDLDGVGARWRWIARITSARRMYQLATLSVCTPSTTRPSSSSRTGEPLRLGDDERTEGRRVLGAAGRHDVEHLMGAVERAVGS